MLGPLADQIERYMDLLSARQKLVASNIANVDTPGYHTQDIDFQFEFLSQTQSGVKSAPDVVDVPGLLIRNDGNDVNLDREARLLAENAIRFTLASTLMKGEIKSIRSAIQEGKG